MQKSFNKNIDNKKKYDIILHIKIEGDNYVWIFF